MTTTHARHAADVLWRHPYSFSMRWCTRMLTYSTPYERRRLPYYGSRNRRITYRFGVRRCRHEHGCVDNATLLLHPFPFVAYSLVVLVASRETGLLRLNAAVTRPMAGDGYRHRTRNPPRPTNYPFAIPRILTMHLVDHAVWLRFIDIVTCQTTDRRCDNRCCLMRSSVTGRRYARATTSWRTPFCAYALQRPVVHDIAPTTRTTYVGALASVGYKRSVDALADDNAARPNIPVVRHYAQYRVVATSRGWWLYTRYLQHAAAPRYQTFRWPAGETYPFCYRDTMTVCMRLTSTPPPTAPHLFLPLQTQDALRVYLQAIFLSVVTPFRYCMRGTQTIHSALKANVTCAVVFPISGRRGHVSRPSPRSRYCYGAPFSFVNGLDLRRDQVLRVFITLRISPPPHPPATALARDIYYVDASPAPAPVRACRCALRFSSSAVVVLRRVVRLVRGLKPLTLRASVQPPHEHFSLRLSLRPTGVTFCLFPP